MNFRPRRRAFTLLEILVVIAIIGTLLAILLPAIERSREKANTLRCAANLSQIGVGLLIYANENQGQYPRATYDPAAAPVAGTGVAGANPFGAGGPQANDVSAALFLLIRVEHLPAVIFIDPYTDEVEGVIDPVTDPLKQSNFTNYKQNLGYSYANPYPSKSAADAGFQSKNKINASFALAGDENPGTGLDAKGRGFNSRNHEGSGQNVLYADNHVDFVPGTNVGQNQDEIYLNKSGAIWASPVDATDSVLLPTDK